MLVSCAKEQLVPASAGKTVLDISISDTKLTLGALDNETHVRPTYWDNGDAVCCNGVVSEALSGIAAQTRTASFTFNEPLSEPYNILYPASIWKSASEIELPAISKVIPMAGQGTTIAALTGIIKLSLAAGTDTDEIMKVVISSPTAQLSGAFSIDYATGTITGQSSADADKSVSKSVSKVLPAEGVAEVFIPVPAGTYGFTARIIDVMGHYMDVTTTSAKTIVAGQVSAFPTVTFQPTGTQVDIEIETAADLIKFAQDWNSGAFDYKPLVKVIKDIEFDAESSAAFVATGGIGVQGDETLGTSDNYFNGLFDGDGHSIKNFTSMSDGVAVPLFAYTGADGIIKNLTFDETCTLSYPKSYSAPFVGRHKGILSNCVNNADVNLTMVAGATYFGGLVGRVYEGTIENCTMNGDILNGTSNGSTKVYDVGGIAATLEAGGKIIGCETNGKIVWAVQPISGASGPQLKSGTLYLGGIVGNLISGTVSGCSVNAADAESTMRGNAGTCAIGGIAGYVQGGGTVTDCVAKQVIYARLSSGTIMNIGGVAGNNEGIVKDSSNEAKVTGNGGQLTINIGGVAGRNAGTVSGSTNSGQVVGPSQYTEIALCNVGGIVGNNEGTIDDSETVKNTGVVNVDGIEKCVKVVANVGGIAGTTSTSLSNCNNSGTVTLGRGTDATSKTMQCVGGIVGYIETEGITIEASTNTGAVTFNATSKLNGRPNRLGGIAGCVNAGGVTISNCVNEGDLKNSNFNNTYTLAGGAILGGIVGVALGTEEKPVLVDACVNQKGIFQGQRGIAGGVVGYIDHTKVSACVNTQNTGAISANITFNSSAICGWAINSVIEHTSANCDINQKSSATAKFGGVVSKLDAGCLLDDCSFSGKVTIQYADGASAAGIANTSVEGSTIKNCKFGGTYSLDGGTTYSAFTLSDICTDTNFTDGGGNTLL